MDLDQKQRELETERSQLQARSNQIGKTIGERMKGGANPKDPEIQDLRQEGSTVKATLSDLEPKERDLKAEIGELLLTIPNLPSDDTPVGKDETANVEVSRWGNEYIPKNAKLAHWEIGENLGILNFERSVKIAQSRFATLVGRGLPLSGL